MTRDKTLGALAVVLALISVAPLAQAQPAAPNAAETERARELFARGMKSFKDGKFEDARSSFLAAWAMRKHWQVAGALGESELKVGRHRDAAVHLAFAVREGAADPAAKDIANLRAGLADAKRKVGEVTLTTVPDGADVTLDGAPLGTSPLVDPIFVEPGAHAIEIKKVGFVAKREEMTLQAGESKPLRIELTREGASAPPPVPPAVPPTLPPPERETPALWPGFVIGGVGLAGVGVGVALIAAGGSKTSEGDDLSAAINDSATTCDPPVGPRADACAAADDAYGSGGGLQTGGVIALGIGGAAVVGGAVYLIWAATSGEPPTTAVTPWVSPDVLGAGFHRSF